MREQDRRGGCVHKTDSEKPAKANALPRRAPGLRDVDLPSFALVAVGFALQRLWIIYSQNLTAGVLATQDAPAVLDVTVLAAGALTALALALLRPRPGALRTLCCAAFAVAYPLVAAAQPGIPAWLAHVSLAAAGVAAGASYVLFGMFFVRLGVRTAIGAMAGTVIAASLVCTVLATLDPAVSLLVTGVVPVALVAIACELAHRLQLAGERECAAAVETGPAAPAPGSADERAASPVRSAGVARLLRLLVALCANNIVIRMLDSVVYAQGRTGVTVFVCFAAQLAVGAVVLALFALSERPARRLVLAYRCVLPVMAVGFLCLALWQSPSNAVSMALIYFSHELFEIAFWVALVALAAGAAHPCPVLGIGIGGVLASMAAGQEVGAWLFGGNLASAGSTLTLIALVCVVGLLLVTIVVLPESLMLSIVQSADPGIDGPRSRTHGPVDGPSSAALAAVAATHALTPRETDVFALLAQGRNVPAVMEELGISRGTANTHVANIYKKLAVHSQQELVELVSSHGAAAGPTEPHD